MYAVHGVLCVALMVFVSRPTGIQARRRAQFAAAIRVAADLDDESLRLVLKFIPAWVKHSEYERAKCAFLPPSLAGLPASRANVFFLVPFDW